jgi:hypothetical protein
MSEETTQETVIEKKAKKAQPPEKSAEKIALVNLLANDAAIAYVEKYKVLRGDDGILVPLEIVERGVVRPVSKEAVLTSLTQRYAAQLLPSAIKNELLPAFMGRLALYALRAEQIRPFRFASDHLGDYAWARLPFDPDQNAACPAEFTQILERCDSPTAARSLVLFMGSLLDYESSRVQYLHLSGNGNDGKSTLTKLLVAVLGSRTCAELRAEDFRDGHATTVLEGARLVLFPDENDARFMSSGRFKSLTGDELLSINPKGQPRRNIVLHCKVVVCSNNRPDVHGTRADLRRIVPVYLKSYEGGEDLGFVARLLSQKYQVMQYCYAEWLRFKATGGEAVPIAAETRDEIEAFATIASAQEVLDRLFVERPGELTLTPAAARAHIRRNEHNGALANQAYSLLRSKIKIRRANELSPRTIEGWAIRSE